MTSTKNTFFNNKKNSQTLWIYGKHSVYSALNNPNRVIKQVLISDKKLLQSLEPLTKNIKVKVDNDFFHTAILPKGAVHQGYAVETINLKQPDLTDIIDNSNCLILLDQITDPHNVGAIIRSAAAFGADAVITTNDNSPNESSTLIKSSSGTFEIIPYIKVVNLKNCIKYLKDNGFWCAGLDANTNINIDSVSLSKKIAFIMGSEDTGLRKLTKENCDMLIKLPISPLVESLNVSNAAAISLYEYRKQYKL